MITVTTDPAPTGLDPDQLYGMPPNDYGFVTKTNNPMVFYVRGNSVSGGCMGTREGAPFVSKFALKNALWWQQMNV